MISLQAFSEIPFIFRSVYSLCLISILTSRKHRGKSPFECIFMQLIIIQGLCFSYAKIALANIWSPPNICMSPSLIRSDFLLHLKQCFFKRYQVRFAFVFVQSKVIFNILIKTLWYPVWKLFQFSSLAKSPCTFQFIYAWLQSVGVFSLISIKFGSDSFAA